VERDAVKPGVLHQVCRWTTALILLQYGFAKLFGAQFTILDSQLDTPMGMVSGFWLTWYYFDYSPIMGNLVGLVQIGLGAALALPRTVLLGAAGAFAALGGISVLNVSYEIDFGALVISLVGTACAAYLLWERRRELAAVFWQAGRRVRAPWRSVAVLAVLVGITASCSYWTANYNNRLPTPLDGTWDVTAGAFAPAGLPGPAERVYFEHNRAYQLVLRSGQTWQTHHFEVDPATATIGVWREWLRKGEQLLSGRYALTGDRLVVTGTNLTTRQPLRWELRRVPPERLRPG
jgi:hypothetical protein